jgi:hypothetical protein
MLDASTKHRMGVAIIEVIASDVFKRIPIVVPYFLYSQPVSCGLECLLMMKEGHKLKGAS